MATSPLRTALNLELAGRGLTSSTGVVTAALNQSQIEELCAVATARGCKVAMPAPVAAVCDEVRIGTVASKDTHYIKVRASTPGPGSIVTVAVADAGGDTLAVTNTAGAIAIALANTTDSKNTLTLIAAAIAAANPVTDAAHAVSCTIVGTASTQVVHGGTNTVTAQAPGAAASGAIGGSTLGVAALPSAATGAFTITPV